MALSSNESTAKRAQEKLYAKKRKRRNILIAIAVILACLLSVAGAWAYSFLNMSFDDDELRAKEELINLREEVWNVE